MGEIWEYDDLDFDNRVINLMWTVCGNYEAQMEGDEKTGISKQAALYYGITAGGRRRFIEWELVDGYVSARVRQGFHPLKLKQLVLLAINPMVTDKLMDERPGIRDIERDACCEMVQLMEEPAAGNLEGCMEYDLLTLLGGLEPAERESSRIAREIIGLRRTPTTEALLEQVDELFIRIYQKKHVRPFDLEAFMQKNRDPGNMARFAEEAAKQLAQRGSARDSAEDDGKGGKVSEAGIVLMDSEELDNMHQQVAHYCGSTYLHAHQLKKIQGHLCRGVHRDCYLHYTEGVLRSTGAGAYQKKFALKDLNRNRTAWEANQAVYLRVMKRLRDALVRTLTVEREKNPVIADSGEVDARRVWRVGRTATTRIFRRYESNDKGGFVVDLMLDASTSQKGRESLVAVQAYILAGALTEAGIPCRVTGFNCFLDFTVLKRFRDYDDSFQKTAQIFEYYCEGSNRDGLAIKGVLEQLYQREEENKILIVLSDGKPNDIHLVRKERKNPFRGEKAYSGGLAVGDTAKEIRIARTRGISVLGVFTGNEQDLKAEKLIYGKDFIYTRDIRHFADIVITYLKRIITQ